MGLTLVSVQSGFVVFTDADGNELVATPLPVAVPLVMWDDFDLQSAWRTAIRRHRETYRLGNPDRRDFEAELIREVAGFGAVDIVWCDKCGDPVKADDAESVDGGNAHACSSCFEDSYYSCADCGRVVHCDSTLYTLSDESVCDRCRNNYSFCDDCDGYYHDSDGGDHSHDGCDCEPPTLALTFPNGEATLAQDERLTVSLPAGVISDEGMTAVTRLVREQVWSITDADGGPEARNAWWDLSYHVSAMDQRWQTKEGNFTKRLSKLAHKTHGLKFPPALLTKVGNVARDQSNGTDVNVELTRNLNLSAKDFYHEDSCWWQSYSDSRCALKSNGGIGMRTFSERGAVSGRAWIMPLRADADGALRATFDSQTADAYVVFNGYGDLTGCTPARIVAGLVGMTYRKIVFDCSPMYVNGNSGYLIASEEIVSKYANGECLSLDVDTHARLFDREAAASLVSA